MKRNKVHWRPLGPVSWPSGAFPQRIFLLAPHVVCTTNRSSELISTTAPADVTCLRCLRIAAMARFDTPDTIRKLLNVTEAS